MYASALLGKGNARSGLAWLSGLNPGSRPFRGNTNAVPGFGLGPPNCRFAGGTALVLPQNGQLQGLKPLQSTATVVNGALHQSRLAVTKSSETVIPATQTNYGQTKGVMQFTDRAGVSRILEAKSNGMFEGNTKGDGTYQCTELVKRYSGELGFPMKATGDGKLVAQNFAKESSGQFSYVANKTSGALPVPGSVISFNDPNNGPGHVALIRTITKNSDGTYTASLFDQNYPRANGQWKEMTFRQVEGSWNGYFVNRISSGAETVYTATGWANPN